MTARAATLVVLLLIAPPATAGIREDLRKQIHPTAVDIVKVMKQENLKRLKFGAFIPPPDPTSEYATGLRELMIEEVGSAGREESYPVELVENVPEMTITANMVYKTKIETAEKAQLSVIQVKFQLEKREGEFRELAKALVEMLRTVGNVIGDPNIVAAMIGANMSFRSGQSTESQKKQINDHVNSQEQTFQIVEKTKVKPVPGSPYSIEILSVPEGQVPQDAVGWINPKINPVPIGKSKDGKNPFVDLKPGTAYAIKVYIDSASSAYDAAVEVAIDGIDVFHFVDPSLRKADGKPKYQYYVCPRTSQGGYLVIPGWHNTNKESYSFVVREHGKGSTKRVSSPATSPGMITVRIAGAWDAGEEPPASVRGMAAGKPETDTGAPIRTDFKEVAKQIGKFNNIVSIHYTH